MRRRPNIIIYMEILAQLRDGAKGPTRLAQATGLNFDKLLEFANLLESRRLIKKELQGVHELYSITPDGYQLHEDWGKFFDRLNMKLI